MAGTTPAVFIRERIHRRRYLLSRELTPFERRFNVFTRLLTTRATAAEVRLFDLDPWFIGQSRKLWRHISGERTRLAAREARLTLLSDGLNALAYIGALALGLALLAVGRAGVGAFAAFFYAVEEYQFR